MLKVLRRILLSIPKKLHFLFIFCLLVNFSAVYAEGSKDLYPAGVKGNRAFLYSNNAAAATGSSVSFPFKTLGTHYVYAKANEFISVASSAQGTGDGQIWVTSPSGVKTIISAYSRRIPDRLRELNGPRHFGKNDANKYTPSFVSVNNEEGIWKVEFLPPGSETSTDNPEPTNNLADGNWTTEDDNAVVIAAWDISVEDPGRTIWRKGRVYTNLLNLKLYNTLADENRAYHGMNYVLTKDGRVYRVKNNGNNGFAFTFFSNNKGFIKEDGSPIYKSLNTTNAQVIKDGVHDPRIADDEIKNLVTHKLFYQPPSDDLPSSAPVVLWSKTPSTTVTSTWLKNTAIVPIVTNVRFNGSEAATPNQAGQKGGIITFTANVPGTYRITIPIASPGRDKVIAGLAVQGENRIEWRGLDGDDHLVSPGLLIPKIKVRLSSAEVHFPFIDMEINPKGIIIELAENQWPYVVNDTSLDESVYSDRVYWDDSDVSDGMAGEGSSPKVNNIEGASSRTLGHKWGTYSPDLLVTTSGNDGKGSYSFGNEKSMDTYAYILSNEEAAELNVNIKVADLKIVSINPVGSHLTTGKALSYIVKVKNDGPSDVIGAKFQFLAPAGFQIASAILSASSCATEGGQSINGNNYSSSLNLKNGCEITYTITGTIGAAMSAPPFRVEANIMRPADLTDPDATNTEFTQMPVSSAAECAAVPSVNGCNNIMHSNVAVQEICVNTDITAIVYNGMAGGQVSLSGSVAGLDFVFTSGNTVLTVNGRPTASGSFTVGTVGNETETTTYIINVNQPPVLQPLSHVSVCEDKNAVFTVTSAETGLTYKWQFNDGKGGGWEDFAAGATGVSGVNTASVTLSNVPLASSGKQLRVIVTSELGCSSVSSTSVLTVVKLPGKPVVLPSSNGFCVGTSVTLTYNPPAAVKAFQWYKDGVIIAGAIQKIYQVSEKGSYHIVVKNIEGCESLPSDAILIDVFPEQPQPEVTIEGSTTFCAGKSVKLTSSFSAGNQWYRDGSPMAGEDKQILIVSDPGLYSVVVKNLNGCSAISEEIEVFVNPVPGAADVEVTEGNLTFCTGDQVILKSNKTAGNQWYKNGVIIDGATLQSYTANTSGTYTVVVTENGCPSPASAGKVVTVNLIPGAADVEVTEGNLTFCTGDQVILKSNKTTGNQWYKNGVIIDGATSQSYTANTSGTYTVMVTENGCPSPASAGKVVTVNLIPGAADVEVTEGNLTFCTGDQVVLKSNKTAGNQWYKNGIIIDGATLQSYTANTSGTYTVVVTENGCPSPASAGKVVTVNLIPGAADVEVTEGNLTFCTGDQVILKSNKTAGNQWYKNGIIIDGATLQSYTANTSGTYTVVVTENGCPSPASAGKVVTVNLIPDAADVEVTEGNLTFCTGDQVVLKSNKTAGNQWYKNGIIIDGATSQSYTANTSGTYTVVVTENGCPSPASAGKVVTVNLIPGAADVEVTEGNLTFCTGDQVILKS
ncbi:hypothetical protein SAMN05421820_1071, partial [Pedobacter steynii]